MAYAQQRGLSQRQACLLAGIARASTHYVAHPRSDTALVEPLQQIKSSFRASASAALMPC